MLKVDADHLHGSLGLTHDAAAEKPPLPSWRLCSACLPLREMPPGCLHAIWL